MQRSDPRGNGTMMRDWVVSAFPTLRGDLTSAFGGLAKSLGAPVYSRKYS